MIVDFQFLRSFIDKIDTKVRRAQMRGNRRVEVRDNTEEEHLRDEEDGWE